MENLELLVTLWPSFSHFSRFAYDDHLSGIRLNSAMVKGADLEVELAKASACMRRGDSVPLWFDIKGRQLRVTEVLAYNDHLELTLNHPISVETPTDVLFKAGEDYARLLRVVDGTHLVFEGGPHYMVYEGESLHIRHPSLSVKGPLFHESEIPKIEKAVMAGFNRFFLSYVESQRDIDEFRDYVRDSQVIAKIENKKGLEYVRRDYRRRDNLSLLCARGDLYVELDKPHEILEAQKMIIEKDPTAMLGSRVLLSVIHSPVPSCSDFSELAWLYDIGYRRVLLCDELCLKGPLLSTAVNTFDQFRSSYITESKKRGAVGRAYDLIRGYVTR